MIVDEDCDHRWTPRGNGISICELCERTAFTTENRHERLKVIMNQPEHDLTREWPAGKDDLNTLSFAAFRYALGRKSYIVEMVAHSLSRNAKHIRKDIKTRMCEDILRAIDNNEAGMECDIIEWRKVLEAFK